MRVSEEFALPVSLGVVAVATLYAAYSALKPTSPTQKKVILVTGASAGMGKDFALALLKEGHIVYGAARRIDRMQDIQAAGGKALACDVTKADQVKAAVDTILKEQNGRIDVLINNAGYGIYGAVEDVTDAEAKRQFDVNLFGLAEITKAVLPAMREAKSGCIINISSMGGRVYTPFGAWYHATKYAVEGWSDCLRIELEPFGIKVVIMEPGAIATEFGDTMRGPALERSKGSPYEPYVKKMFKTFESFEKSMSHPSVITKAIVEIVKSKNPKRRYLLGANAKPMVFIRNWFGDAVYDSLMLSMTK